MFDLRIVMFDLALPEFELEVVATAFPVCSELFSVVGQDGSDRDAMVFDQDVLQEIDR